MGHIRDFMETHYLHFNAREMVDAARAWEEHLDAGGRMLVTLAGAMSTGELGISLSRMIREEKVHAVSCTGAICVLCVGCYLAGSRFPPAICRH